MFYEARAVARLIAALLLVLLLGLPVIASAASPYDARFAYAGNVVHAYEPTITGWEHQSHVSFAVSVTIAAFGLAIVCLQIPGRRWTRPATLVIGALVAALAVHTTFFYGDPRTLEGTARSLPDARVAATHEALAKTARSLRADPTILASAGAQQAFNSR
jgi:cell division protein FtsW (lipid II flippase)